MKQRKKHISTPRPRDQMRNPLGTDGFFGNNFKTEKQGYDLDDKEGQGLFPRYSEWIVFLVTLVLRCNYVSQKDNWWVLHPDEIFQAMEVAYSELQGYGFRPYEFLPPASGPNVTAARMQESMLGMYAMRSFIYPRILTGVGYIALLLGYNSSLFVLWRMFHASITSCLPLSVYVFCKVVTGNHDLSMISCILVASSTHLWVFGTHTLLNSFLSPFVFLVIGYLIKFITTFFVEKNDNGNVQEKRNALQHNNNNNDYNIHTMNNCNGIHRCNKQVDTSKYESVQIGRNEFRVYHVFIVGYFSGLFVYIRPDLLSLFICVLLPYMPRVLTHLKAILSSFVIYICISGCVTGILTGVLEDFLSYGSFVVTPFQWISFNVFNGYAKRMFGTMPTLYYLQIFFGNNILIYLSVSIFFVTIYTFNKTSVLYDFLRKTSLTFICMFLMYSLQGHKEARFLHDTIVLFCICSGLLLYILVQQLSLEVSIFSSKRLTQQVCLCCLLFCFISSQYQSMPNSIDNSVKDWTYEGKTDSHDVNVCLDFIGRQSDVTGVFVDRDIHMTGGYTVLRQNVPWFSLINTEFREFSKESRLAVWSFYGNREISITSQVSNYIHIQNTPFLLKCMIRQKEYNYLVMKTTRQFITRGYVEVFKYGTMRVLKRLFDSQEESYLETVEKSITDNKNTTILKYEGQWLMSYGSYNLAEKKFIKSAEINSDLQVFQFLVELYRRKGEPVKARTAFIACKQKFVEKDCLKPARKITLFEHERISLK